MPRDPNLFPEVLCLQTEAECTVKPIVYLVMEDLRAPLCMALPQLTAGSNNNVARDLLIKKQWVTTHTYLKTSSRRKKQATTCVHAPRSAKSYTTTAMCSTKATLTRKKLYTCIDCLFKQHIKSRCQKEHSKRRRKKRGTTTAGGIIAKIIIIYESKQDLLLHHGGVTLLSVTYISKIMRIDGWMCDYAYYCTAVVGTQGWSHQFPVETRPFTRHGLGPLVLCSIWNNDAF